MGTDKALLNLGRKSLIEHVIERVAGLVKSVNVVTNDADSYMFLGLPIIHDVEPDKGPLMGLYTGITSCKTPWILAVACDTPFIEPRLLETILARSRTGDIVATEFNDQAQPLPALYSSRCAKVAMSLLSTDRRALRDLLASVEISVVPETEVRQVDPKLGSFFDIDTKADLRRAERLIKSAR